MSDGDTTPRVEPPLVDDELAARLRRVHARLHEHADDLEKAAGLAGDARTLRTIAGDVAAVVEELTRRFQRDETGGEYRGIDIHADGDPLQGYALPSDELRGLKAASRLSLTTDSEFFSLHGALETIVVLADLCLRQRVELEQQRAEAEQA